jgi:hypothetical protein
MPSTPWGAAAVLDEVVLSQKAPGPREFTTHVQLLEAKSGERLVRLAYATAEHGSVRRGPVTLTVDDLVRLLEELAVAGHEELAGAFGLDGTRRGRAGARGLRRRANRE